MTTSNNAREIFRAAYENRYTWDDNFPGYTADLKLTQGDEVYQGKIKVDSDLSVEVTEIEDETVKESVCNQMRDIITHRKRSSFEAAHGKNKFSLGEEDHTGAVEINVAGDAMGSNYKVRDREICYVSRVMGPMAFTINTKENLNTEGGYISVKYNAVFRDSKTDELKGKRDFQEEYEEFGGYYLPTRQLIEGIDKGEQKIVTEFNFSNIKLLQPATVA